MGSQPRIGRNGRPTYRMIVCSVLGKAFQIEGHLRDRECMHDVVNARALCEDDIDQMIEPCAASRARYGVGASIAGLDGSVWGRVVAEECDCWRLHSGRIAKKHTEGCKWKWCFTEECSADNREGSAEKCDLLFIKVSVTGAVRDTQSSTANTLLFTRINASPNTKSSMRST